MKRNYLLILFIAHFFSFDFLTAQNIAINEVLAANTSINTDEDGSYEDWVELYNYGAVAVNLNGYGLSDDGTQRFKWIFPAVTLSPGQYLLVWCSDKNRTTVGSPLHTNFKIGSGGEALYLTNTAAVTLATVPAVVLQDNVSYGKSPNGTGSYFYFGQPTPGAANTTTAYSEALSPPQFSRNSGFYTTNFSLTLSTPTPGATIIYTTDGSEPSETNLGGTTYSYKNSYAELVGQTGGPMLQNSFRSFNYAAPITVANRTSQPNKLSVISSTYSFEPVYFPDNLVFKGTVVRAKVIKPGALSSPVATKSYFITPNGTSEFSFPVASISLSENKFFDYNNGIFVAGAAFDAWRAANPNEDALGYNCDANYELSGDASERTGHLSYLVNGNEVLSQNIGIRINGDSSRTWPSKSLRLMARSEYGDNDFSYSFFSDEALTKFNRLILRNAGGDYFETYYRGALAHELTKGLGLETQAYQPTITFVNGEYWGILNLRERYDKYYFINAIDIPDGELDLLVNDLTPEEGDQVHYNAMATFLTNNSLATAANFNYIKTQMDVENMRDYYISNIYFDNVDWPGWNTLFWRKRTAYNPNALYGQDGRWRAAMSDNDDCFASDGAIDNNNLELATATNGPAYPNPPSSTLILRSLLANESFKIDFINRFADLMNTYYHPDRFVALSNTFKNRLEPEIQEHFARWEANNYAGWINDIALVNQFGTQRPNFQRQHIRQKFGISSNITATLNVSNMAHGYVQMNTVAILETTPGVSPNPYPWSGIYFHNIPVKIKAIAKPGYRFSNWSGASNSTQEEITLTPTANFSVTANFVPNESPNTPEVIYFWMMDNAIPNDTPLTSLNSSFERGANGVLQYTSCLAGYPFTSTNPNWRKASMERRNLPTPINYIPQANGDVVYANSNMRGLQIKQPFQSGGLQNTLVFNLPTQGYKEIKFAAAIIDEGAASGIVIDYSTVGGTPVWTTAGLLNSAYAITSAYQRIETDFTNIASANNNANFKVRLRFTGPNMTADTGARVTFNNISVAGAPVNLSVNETQQSDFLIYPNPVTDIIHVAHDFDQLQYTLFAIDGKQIQQGELTAKEMDVSHLSAGMYLLQLRTDGKSEVKKFIKR